MHARHEVADFLLLALDAFAHLLRVRDAFLVDDFLPVSLLHLHLVLDAGVVADFRYFGLCDEPLLEVGAAAEHGRVVGHGVVLAAHGGEAQEHGKLASAGAFAGHAVAPGLAAHEHEQVAQRVVEVEQGDALDLACGGRALFPVGVVDVAHASRAVGLLEARPAGFLVDDAVDARAVAAEDEHGHGEEVVLHVRSLLEEEGAEAVALREAPCLRVGRGLPLQVLELEARAVAGEDVEELVLGGHFVRPHKVAQLVGEFVVRTEGRVEFAGTARHGAELHAVAVEEPRGVFHGGHGGLRAVRAEVEHFGLEEGGGDGGHGVIVLLSASEAGVRR